MADIIADIVLSLVIVLLGVVPLLFRAVDTALPRWQRVAGLFAGRCVAAGLYLILFHSHDYCSVWGSNKCDGVTP